MPGMTQQVVVTRMLDLDPREVSLVRGAAVQRKFITLKSGGGAMPFLPNDVLKSLESAKLTDKGENVVKGLNLPEREAAILKGALLLLETFKDGLPKDDAVIKAVAEVGFTLPSGPKVDEALKAMKAEEITKILGSLSDDMKTELSKTLTKKADDPMEVLKSLPDGIRQTVEKAFGALDAQHKQSEKDRTEAVKKLIEAEKARKVDSEVTKASAFKSIPVNPKEIGEVMAKLAESDPDAYAKIGALLKASDEALTKADIFREAGASGGSPSDGPDGELKAKAEEIKKADPKLSNAQAMAKAVKDNPEIYRRWKEGE